MPFNALLIGCRSVGCPAEATLFVAGTKLSNNMDSPSLFGIEVPH